MSYLEQRRGQGAGANATFQQLGIDCDGDLLSMSAASARAFGALFLQHPINNTFGGRLPRATPAIICQLGAFPAARTVQIALSVIETC